MRSAAVRAQIEAALADRIPSALTPRPRPAPQLLPTGIATVDALAGGLSRGALTEICGPASSGRTTLLHSILAQAGGHAESVALIDAADAFDPHSAAAAGVDLRRLLWVRCSKEASRRETRNVKRETFAPIEQALKATDLLLQSGGFGLVVVDLADTPPDAARRVPLASWFRFRRAVENTPTALLVLEQEPYAKTCASLVLRLDAKPSPFRRPPSMQQDAPAHSVLLDGMRITVEIARDRTAESAAPPKPPRSTRAEFDSRQIAG